MSANQSNLSPYGCDFVVATTLKSINLALKDSFYNTTFPTVRFYVNANPTTGDLEPVSYDDLMSQTNGTDPFSVPAWYPGGESERDPALDNIFLSDFCCAAEASFGVPQNFAPEDIPDIITYEGNGDEVIFNLLFSKLTMVSSNLDAEKNIQSFDVNSQPDDQAWIISARVNLKEISGSANLPNNVQEQLNLLGTNLFDVRKLMADLENGSFQLIRSSDKSPVPDKCAKHLCEAGFLKAMQESSPVLNYSIVRKPSNTDPYPLRIGSTAFEISPYKPENGGQENMDLYTINFLSSESSGILTPKKPFQWNWMEPSDAANSDGVVAINRSALAWFLRANLDPYASQNCFAPSVTVTADIGGTHYAHDLKRGNTPTVEMPPSGSNVLVYGWDKDAWDHAGPGGSFGYMDLHTKFDLCVSFSGNTIIVDQRLYIHTSIRSLTSSVEWSPVQERIVDTYTLAVTENGDLTANLSSSSTHESENKPDVGHTSDVWTHIGDISGKVSEWLSKFAPTSAFRDMPRGLLKQAVFPGGKTFAYKEASFSDNQDLVSHISYTQAKSAQAQTSGV